MSFDDHFAGTAVENDSESLSVVEKIQGDGIRAAPLFCTRRGCFAACRGVAVPEFRAEAEFVADAVSGAHQFDSRPVCQFVGRFGHIAAGFRIQFFGKMV